MLRIIIDTSVQSFGLLPLMALIFLAAIAIIIERVIFFGTSVRNGASLPAGASPRDLDADIELPLRARNP